LNHIHWRKFRTFRAAISGALLVWTLPALAQQSSQQPAPPAQQLPPGQPPAPSASAESKDGERVIVIGSVPVPNVGAGAPYHSVEDLAQIDKEAKREAGSSLVDARSLRQCRLQGSPLDSRLSYIYPSMELLLDEEVQAAYRVTIEVKRSQLATEAAEKSRVDAAAGNVDMKAVEAAELARQAAVNKLDEARIAFLEAGAAIADFQELERRGRVAVNVANPDAEDGLPILWDDLEERAERRRKAGWWLGIPVPEPYDGLHILQIEARERTEKGRPVLMVTGQVRNDRDRSVSLPEMVVSAVDSKGFVLIAKPVGANSGVRIPAKSARNFAYELRPSPGAASKVAVSFASKIGPPPRLRVQRPEDC
jgi:hypothetical protein